eukprot:3188263-Rhodomonas_salina.1
MGNHAVVGAPVRMHRGSSLPVAHSESWHRPSFLPHAALFPSSSVSSSSPPRLPCPYHQAPPCIMMCETTPPYTSPLASEFLSNPSAVPPSVPPSLLPSFPPYLLTSLPPSFPPYLLPSLSPSPSFPSSLTLLPFFPPSLLPF